MKNKITKRLYALRFVPVLMLLATLFSCDGSDNEPSNDSFPAGEFQTVAKEVKHDGCKSYYTRTNINEFVQLQGSESNRLVIKHIDTMLNCEPGRISIGINLSHGVIAIREKEETAAANCVCPYDLTYAITELPYGTYRLIINGYEFGNFAFSLTTDVKLYKQLSPTSR